MAAKYPYTYNMAPVYDDSPEVANSHPLPEVYSPQRETGPWSPHESAAGSVSYAGQSSVKPEDPQPYNNDQNGAYQGAPASTISGTGVGVGAKRKGICGCATLVFVLSLIIAILSAAVIGLAAGAGVATSNYNDANTELKALKSSFSSYSAAQQTASPTATGSGASPSSTGYSNITNNCSDKDETTTGKTYKPFFFGKPTFTMYCNKDAPNESLLSLFSSDFNGCMDACAAWNSYNASSKKCNGISFIPLWSIPRFAQKGGAPGDCYLKPGPQTQKNLTVPNIGTECHAAILKTSN